jgi:hypothetical protein
MGLSYVPFRIFFVQCYVQRNGTRVIGLVGGYGTVSEHYWYPESFDWPSNELDLAPM